VLVKARRTGDLTLRAIAPDEAREIFQSWENSPFHPWFLEKSSSGVVTVAETQTVALPSDFLLQVEDTDWYLEDVEGAKTRLKRGYHEDLEAKFNGEDEGLPWAYDIFAQEIYLGPIPDAIYTLRFKYYAKQTPPPDDSAEVTNKWIINAEALCVTAVAHKLVSDYVKDTVRAKSLAEDVTRLRVELHKFNEAKKHADMNYGVDR
jgi:hypothetical protein